MPRTVLILLGSSAAGSFSLSGVASGTAELFTVRDCLSCGPLMPIADVSSWKRARLAYWRSLGPPESDEPEEDLSENPDVLVSADEVQLWLSPELADQIALAWLPAFLRIVDVDPGRLKTVQFLRSDRGIEILGLGMLNPQQLAAHPPATSVPLEDLVELDRVWRALTSPEPDELADYLHASSERSPLLKRALRGLPLRYPDSLSGVNTKEAQLLRRVRGLGPNTVRVLGQVLSDDYDAVRAGAQPPDLVGDSWWFSRMLRFSDPALRDPALQVTGSRVTYRDAQVRLTPFGQRILDGKANFVEANGIDDWVAGVHLQSEAGRVWFHRAGELIRA